MGAYKGSSIILLKKMLEASGPQAKQTFLDSLTPEERNCFEAIVPTTWVPDEEAEAILGKFAAFFYPNDPDGFFKLGETRANDTLKGLYKALFNLLSTEAIIDNSYRLWPMLHNQGKARVERKPGTKEAAFIVSNYPGLSRNFRVMMSGFISGCLKLSGAKSFKLNLIESDPNHWMWHGSWE